MTFVFAVPAKAKKRRVRLTEARYWRFRPPREGGDRGTRVGCAQQKCAGGNPTTKSRVGRGVVFPRVRLLGYGHSTFTAQHRQFFRRPNPTVLRGAGNTLSAFVIPSPLAYARAETRTGSTQASALRRCCGSTRVLHLMREEK